MAPAVPAADRIRHIPVDRILPNPHQPRKSFDPQALEELRASIAEHGVLVPVLVREIADGYELIAGERRWRACAGLQRPTIPAIVRSSTELESLEVAIIENLQREDLNPLEEAAGISQLIEAHGFTQDEVAQRLGKSRPAVTNALRLLSLPEAIKSMVVEGRLGAAHALMLLAAPEGARLELAQRVVNEGLSVRALERVVDALRGASVHKTIGGLKRRTVSAEDRDFESRLRTRLGAQIALRRNGTGGRIEIRYANEADLIRIAEILLEE
jgi:ParB family chromosome partitioning protein